MNKNNINTNGARITTATRRDEFTRQDANCAQPENASSENTPLEYTFEEVELPEDEYWLEYWHIWGDRAFTASDVPIGFERKDGPYKRVGTATKRISHKTVLEESQVRYSPIKKYEKAVDECGLTNLFGKKTDLKTITKTLAHNLKSLREWANIDSVTDLAYSTDVTRQYIAQLEKEQKCPSLKTLCQIADVFGTNPAMLISLDMPNHYMHYADILFHELSKKDKDKQADILKQAIEFIKKI